MSLDLLGMTDLKYRELAQAGIKTSVQLHKALSVGKVTIPKITRFDLQFPIARSITRRTATRIFADARGLRNRILVPVGSYRRAKPLIGDIDFLSTRPISRQMFKAIFPDYKIHFYSVGKAKISAIIKPFWSRKYYRSDLFFIPVESFVFGFVYLTRGKVKNIILRARAKKMGMLLNRYGLYKNNKRVRGIKTEQDIFRILDIKYKPLSY